ncbi:MAG: ANTAR domain-containing response regulator [Acidiferrobacteraceae bacterium]
MHVMLVDDDLERSALLRRSLEGCGYTVIATIGSTSDLYAAVRTRQPDVIVIDVEAPGRDTLEQMAMITQEQPRPIVMFCGDGDGALIRNAIRAGVSAYVVDGLAEARVKPIMEVAIARFAEFKALRDDARENRTRLEDRKIIERAKGLLMAARRCGEGEAYQALQKMAMNGNRKLVEVARDVIRIAGFRQ